MTPICLRYIDVSDHQWRQNLLMTDEFRMLVAANYIHQHVPIVIHINCIDYVVDKKMNFCCRSKKFLVVQRAF